MHKLVFIIKHRRLMPNLISKSRQKTCIITKLKISQLVIKHNNYTTNQKKLKIIILIASSKLELMKIMMFSAYSYKLNFCIQTKTTIIDSNLNATLDGIEDIEDCQMFCLYFFYFTCNFNGIKLISLHSFFTHIKNKHTHNMPRPDQCALRQISKCTLCTNILYLFLFSITN